MCKLITILAGMWPTAQKKIVTAIQLIIVMGAILFSQFYKLGALPFRAWDESRLITSAYQMARGASLMVPVIEGKPDMWNTKPPLMIWTQALSIHYLGFSEFSARFPAALCAAITMLLVGWFIYQLTQNSWAGVVGVIVLATTRGYIGDHGTRFGEYDSMLALFTTCCFVAIYYYTELTGPKKDRALVGFFIALALAVLTKSIAGLLFTPAYFLYITFRKQLLATLKNPWLYAGILIFVVMVGGYYVLRESLNHGYLKAVRENELGGRFNSALEGHSGPWNFYWKNFKGEHFGVWFWIMPVVFLSVFFIGNAKWRRVMVYALLTVMLFMAVISASKTKLVWYDLPIYPLLAIIIGILMAWLGKILSAVIFTRRSVITALLLIGCSIAPVYEMVNYVNALGNDVEKDSYFALGYYLRDGKNKINLNGVYCAFSEYNIQWVLYTNHLRNLGVKIKDVWIKEAPLIEGDRVLINTQESDDVLMNNYKAELIDSFYTVRAYKIIGCK